MSKRIITFGEIMLRLAPNGYYRFFRMHSFRPRSAEERRTWRYLWQTMGWMQLL